MEPLIIGAIAGIVVVLYDCPFPNGKADYQGTFKRVLI